MTLTGIVKQVQGCGKKDADGKYPNTHLEISVENEKSNLTCAQSPLFEGLVPGSTVVITVTAPTTPEPPAAAKKK